MIDRPAANPWKWTLIVFVLLAAAGFAFPGAVVDWLDERNSTGWLSAPLAVARGVDAASAAVGVKGLGQGLRSRFAALIGDDQG